MIGRILLATVVALQFCQQASGHGYMMDPPGRASAWRYGFNTPTNYDDNALFCGGFARMTNNGGRCGVCGDPWDGKREYEAGGRFATGTIVHTYKVGQQFTAKSKITANHAGYMEFRICPNNNPKKAVTWDCLNKHVLQLADGSGTRFPVPPRVTGNFETQLKLPDGMTCSQCVLQWKYHAGNSWGRDQVTGQGCVGCGPQEEFYACSDIAIVDDSTNPNPNPGPAAKVTNPPATFPPITMAPITFAPPATNAPAPTKPPVTQAPTTKQVNPLAIGHGGTGVTCHGINNWAGDPKLDAWCTDVCNKGNCPALACDCGTSGANTQAPTTTTKKPTTSTITTRPTTRPTTTTARPITQAPTTQQPSTATQKYLTHVECKAVNLWEGNEYLDRWCADACGRGNCPEESCRCSKVQVPVAIKPETTMAPQPPQQLTKVCSATGVWKGIEVFDKWCTNECNGGNCPANACTCIEVPMANRAARPSTYGKCQSLRNQPYWDQWCQVTCDGGQCANSLCACNV